MNLLDENEDYIYAVTDWKCKVKTKASKLRQSATQTGGGSSNTPPLTPLEEKLIAVMGKKGFEGDEGIRELGIPIRGKTEPVEIFQNVVEDHDYAVLSGQPIEIIEEFEYAGSSSPTQTFSDVNTTIIPLTSRSTLVEDEVLKTKHKHDKHDYCGEKETKGKRTKIKNIPRIT